MRLMDLGDLDRGPGRDLLRATCAMGFSEPVARAGLETELGAWRRPGAIAGVLKELPADLDPRRRPGEVLVIAARTLPVSAMRAVLMGRLLGARVRLKTASGQQALAEAMEQADPGVIATPFTSNDQASLRSHLSEVDAVVVLGDDETLKDVAGVTPAGCVFVGYGHKVSGAWIEHPDEEAAQGLALDLCAWDQGGCLSPQVAWIAGDPLDFLPTLSEAVMKVERALPMALPRAARRGREVARVTGQMLGSIQETETSLLCALNQPRFRSGPGYRTLWLLPMEPAAVRDISPALSSLACTANPPAGLGAQVRLCRPGELQRPPLGWPHDGRPNLLPMLREI